MRTWSIGVGSGMLVVAGLVGCGGDDRPLLLEPVSVRFEYRASTRVNQEVVMNQRACATLVGRTHIHPSWESFDIVFLRPEGAMLWTRTFNNVPSLRVNRIRVSDANVCDRNPTGAVTDRVVYANDVLLTQRVDTPGTGTEPGFSFSVDVEGVVTP